MKKLFICGLIYVMNHSSLLAQQAYIPDFSTLALDGKKIFQENCVQCHGETALGTDLGPPLLHPFYRPGHHNDAALRRAIKKGVMPHHWAFGPMPAIETVKDEEIPKLVLFIRELQRANGIK